MTMTTQIAMSLPGARRSAAALRQRNFVAQGASDAPAWLQCAAAAKIFGGNHA